jgi:hypothetical protein
MQLTRALCSNTITGTGDDDDPILHTTILQSGISGLGRPIKPAPPD